MPQDIGVEEWIDALLEYERARGEDRQESNSLFYDDMKYPN